MNTEICTVIHPMGKSEYLRLPEPSILETNIQLWPVRHATVEIGDHKYSFSQSQAGRAVSGRDISTCSDVGFISKIPPIGIFDGMGKNTVVIDDREVSASRLAAWSARKEFGQFVHDRFVEGASLPDQAEAEASLDIIFNNMHKRVNAETHGEGKTTALVTLPCLYHGGLGISVGWIGDSRLTLTRDRVTKSITTDDGYLEAFFPEMKIRMAWQNRLDSINNQEELELFIKDLTNTNHASTEIMPWANLTNHIYTLVTQTVGDNNLPKPHILTFSVQSGDTLTAVTDGISDPLSPEDINYYINHYLSTEQSAIEILHATQQAGFRFKSDDRWVII